MVALSWSNQVLSMRYPYLVIGPGLDVPTGVPGQLKQPGTTAWWDVEGVGTAFRIAPTRSGAGYAVNVFWGFDRQLETSFPDVPIANGRNTVRLTDPRGTFSFAGTHADGMPILLQFDADVVTYRWSARAKLGPSEDSHTTAPIETVTIIFE